MKADCGFVFVSLAGNQSRFFGALGRKLGEAGYASAHVCFHEGAADEMRRDGLRVFNPFDYQPKRPEDLDFADFGIDMAGLCLGHEKAAYELRNTAALERKFKGHLGAMSRILDACTADMGQVILVQELGGFTPVLAAFFAARRSNIDNWFIEPSFFRGRVFFTPNSFAAPRVAASNVQASPDLRTTLENIRISQSVVIPNKDRPHYRPAFRKLTDTHNARRLLEKVVAKHVRGQREEFDHIGGHVRRHVRMFLNSRKLASHYRGLPDDRPIIYYPLHVPADFALTIRSPEYFDQLATIDFLCRSAPLGRWVVIKEHPALVGALDPDRIRDLLRRHDNLVLLHPGINNHRVLAAAETVVTVNSKAGAEALLYRKPVFALGDSFYADSPLVMKVQGFSGLARDLARGHSDVEEGDVERFFQDVWDSSYPGELYEMSSSNLEVFSDSLRAAIGAHAL